MKNILLIEDDIAVAELIHDQLNQLPAQLSTTELGHEGLTLLANQPYDLCILDLMLPDANGFDVCRRIRQQHPAMPLLILTAKTDEHDKVKGLDSGADDYLTKPFGIPELMARCRALIRRSEYPQKATFPASATLYSYGDLRINVPERWVTHQDNLIDLTPKEFDLLVLLASQPGKIFTRQKIMNLVWGYRNDSYLHTVTSHVNRLRTKIEPDFAQPMYIMTVWGTGYRFALPDSFSDD